MYFRSRQYIDQPTICRLNRIIEKYQIPTQLLLPCKTSTQYTWNTSLPDAYLEWAVMKKNSVLDSVWREMFGEMIE